MVVRCVRRAVRKRGSEERVWGVKRVLREVWSWSVGGDCGELVVRRRIDERWWSDFIVDGIVECKLWL